MYSTLRYHIFPALKILCALLIHPTMNPGPRESLGFFFFFNFAYIILSFLECCIVRIMQVETFPGWLLITEQYVLQVLKC